MTVTITPLVCGVIEGDAAGFVEGAEGKLRLPVYSFLVRHPKATVLFDTGMHPDLQSDGGARLGPIASLFDLHYAPGEELTGRLEAADASADEVDVVVNSHLHFDHAGGNAQVANARVVVQEREWAAGHDPASLTAYTVEDFDLGHDVERIDGEHDLFGDGRLVCVPTYGHTAGHQSLVVRSDDRGEVVLTGDACYLRHSLEADKVPAFGHDLDEQRRSYDILRRLEAAGATLVFGHDEVLPTIFGATPGDDGTSGRG